MNYMSRTRMRDLVFFYINLLLLFATLCVSLNELHAIKEISSIVKSNEAYVEWGISFASILIATGIVATGIYRTSRNLVDINHKLAYGEMCTFAVAYVARDIYQFIQIRDSIGANGTYTYNLVVSILVVLLVCITPLIGKNFFYRWGHFSSFVAITLMISSSINLALEGTTNIILNVMMILTLINIFIHMLVKSYDID